MFSFFQTIFHKVTTVIVAAAIAIGFISTPEPPKQPVLDNQNQVVIEQQVQKNQSEVSISAEAEKLKKEIENLRKNISQQNQSPVALNQPVQPYVQQPQPVQPQRTVPPRPENSDEWTFNWNTWAWEKHPSAPPVAPTIGISIPQPLPTQSQYPQQIQSPTSVQEQITDFKFRNINDEWVFQAIGENFRVVVLNTYRSYPQNMPYTTSFWPCYKIREYYIKYFLKPYPYLCAEGGWAGIISNSQNITEEYPLFSVNRDSMRIIGSGGAEPTFIKAVGETTGKEIIIQ